MGRMRKGRRGKGGGKRKDEKARETVHFIGFFRKVHFLIWLPT